MIMRKDKLEIVQGNDVPQYSLRVSRRAKRMQLKVNPWGKVEVVVPRHVHLSRVAPFVQQHRQWLERALTQVRAMHDDSSAVKTLMPDRVQLLAVAEDWEIGYRHGPRTLFSAEIAGGDRRILNIATAEGAMAHLVLQEWIRDYARRRLLPWLRQVSEECRLPFARAAVRAQKTRWGSCNARGHINLNRHLLFLPPRLVRYIMVHELCHTVHLNHSLRYWGLVSRFEPDYPACEAELRRAARYIPLWAYPE